jgi:hypothetical protein
LAEGQREKEGIQTANDRGTGRQGKETEKPRMGGIEAAIDRGTEKQIE